MGLTPIERANPDFRAAKNILEVLAVEDMGRNRRVQSNGRSSGHRITKTSMAWVQASSSDLAAATTTSMYGTPVAMTQKSLTNIYVVNQNQTKKRMFIATHAHIGNAWQGGVDGTIGFMVGQGENHLSFIGNNSCATNPDSSTTYDYVKTSGGPTLQGPAYDAVRDIYPLKVARAFGLSQSEEGMYICNLSQTARAFGAAESYTVTLFGYLVEVDGVLIADYIRKILNEDGMPVLVNS